MRMPPKVSIVIPIHDMQDGEFFLWRAINSLMEQTFQDFEIVITKQGSMPENTNAGMRKARGEIVKILYLDDYLAQPFALEQIVRAFDDPSVKWLASACGHQIRGGELERPHMPEWNPKMKEGINTLGSPSVMSFRREGLIFFDEKLSWLLDCDLYQQYYDSYGPPKISPDIAVIIGIGDHQMSNLLTDEQKQKEHDYLKQKYA